MAKNTPELSPAGAFTIDLWFQPKPEIEDQAIAFLLDKKYYHYARDLPQANWDYCLYLQRAGTGQRQLVANLGYGKDSAVYSSRTFALQPGQWYHFAFTYDGAGTGRFFVDGRPAGRTTHEGRGPVTAGTYDLVLGDRYGSLYVGCAGILDEVRLSRGIAPGFGGTLEVDTSGQRLAFLRGETNATVGLKLFNDTDEPMTGVRVHWSSPSGEHDMDAPDLAPRTAATLQLPVDTMLRPEGYIWNVTVSGNAGTAVHRAESRLNVIIARRPLPHRMPVVMWGNGDIDTVQEIGFTHQLVNLADEARIWEAQEPTTSTTPERIADMTETLDAYLARGLGAVANLSPGSWVTDTETNKQKFQRVDLKGQPYERANACGLFPEVQAFAFRTGASVAQTFGHFPALQAALIHTEIRDGTGLCFHEHDRAAYRAETGQEIPEAAIGVNGVNYSRLADFPATRIIPDDHPLLRFYHWFWKEGDGWNALHSQVHRGLKSAGRDGSVDVFRSGRACTQRLGQRRRSGCHLAVDLFLSRPDQDRPGHRRVAGDGRRRGERSAGHEDDADHLVPQPDRARADPRTKLGVPPWEKEIPDAPLHHHRTRSSARSVLEQDLPAHPRHHVPRLGIAGCGRARQLSLHQPRDARRADRTGARCGPAAGADAGAASRSAK